jgi:hypothetical protein
MSGPVIMYEWLDAAADRELVDIVHEGFDQLKAVAAGS